MPGMGFRLKPFTRFTAALICLLVIALAVASCALGGQTSTPAPTATPVTVQASVGLDARGGAEPVPSYFAGFSIESSSLCQFLALEKRNPAVDRFYLLLSPMIIRIGGTSGDAMRWSPDAPCDGRTLGIGAVADVFAFARRVHAKIIWSLNLRANDPLAASAEANAVLQAAGGQLQGIEMGNEPNNWTSQTGYERVWEGYASAIQANNASGQPVPFAGPSMYDDGGRNWFAAVVRREGGSLALVTYHYYSLRTSGHAGDAQIAAIEDLLSPHVMTQTASDLDRAVAVARAQGLGLEIDETNSANNGGVNGVSDTFASALWAADYLFTAAEHGALAVNIHGNGGASSGPSYSPLVTDPTTHLLTARPLYYGMLFFHLATSDGRSIPLAASATTTANLAVHAVANSDGVIRVALINKDLGKSVEARVTLPASASGRSYKTAAVIRMQAPAADARSDVALSGASVGADGSWQTAAPESVAVSGSSFTVFVPAGSAALVTLTPGA